MEEAEDAPAEADLRGRLEGDLNAEETERENEAAGGAGVRGGRTAQDRQPAGLRHQPDPRHHRLPAMSQPLRPCVGVALLNAEGLVFVGQRIDGFADAWQMPQGGIDKGEETEAVALRELEEETGFTADAVSQLAVSDGWHDYELPADLVGKVWKGRYRGQTQKWYAYRLNAGDGAIDIAADEEPEFRCLAWFRAEELLERIVPFKRGVYEKVFADFERWLA